MIPFPKTSSGKLIFDSQQKIRGHYGFCPPRIVPPNSVGCQRNRTPGASTNPPPSTAPVPHDSIKAFIAPSVSTLAPTAQDPINPVRCDCDRTLLRRDQNPSKNRSATVLSSRWERSIMYCER